MENVKGLKVLLVAFIAIIIGVAFTVSLANDTTRVTQANTVTNEQITLINQTAVSLANRQLDSVTSVINATNASQTLTLNTNYTVNLDQGTITSLGRGGLWNVTYVYRQVGNSTARSVIGVLVILFVIGAFLVLLWALSPSFRDLLEQF